MEKIKILVADDHQIFRDGIKSLLAGEENIEVVAEAGDGEEVIEQVKNRPVDEVLMDIHMPNMNGVEASKLLKRHYPDIKILALTMYDDDNHILEILEAGAQGYLLKNTNKNELISAIKALAGGNSYFTEVVSHKILLQLKRVRKQRIKKGKDPNMPLTEREIEVLRLIAEGLTNTQIADKLFISHRTVDTHRRNLLRKLHVSNTAGLVKYAYQHNMILA